MQPSISLKAYLVGCSVFSRKVNIKIDNSYTILDGYFPLVYLILLPIQHNAWFSFIPFNGNKLNWYNKWGIKERIGIKTLEYGRGDSSKHIR